jgi:dynein heavy chain 1
MIPEAKTHEEFSKWIKEIDLAETPAWSGLPNNVEKIVREKRAEELWSNSKLIQGTSDEGIEEEKQEEKGKNEGVSKWLVILGDKCSRLSDMLPKNLTLMERTTEAIKNPLFRFLEREVNVASGLLKTVRNDLLYLKEMCEGERKSTNELRLIGE